MQLSADIYLQLVESLRTEPRRGHEQRASARVGVGGQLKIQIVSSRTGQPPTTINAHLRDLSVDGIGITVDQRISPGTQFSVSLPRNNGSKPLELICEVRHCDERADRVFNIGSRFIGDNAADDRTGAGKNAKRIQQAMFS